MQQEQSYDDAGRREGSCQRLRNDGRVARWYRVLSSSHSRRDAAQRCLRHHRRNAIRSRQVLKRTVCRMDRHQIRLIARWQAATTIVSTPSTTPGSLSKIAPPIRLLPTSALMIAHKARSWDARRASRSAQARWTYPGGDAIARSLGRIGFRHSRHSSIAALIRVRSIEG
jgi:hypothetical protein